MEIQSQRSTRSADHQMTDDGVLAAALDAGPSTSTRKLATDVSVDQKTLIPCKGVHHLHTKTSTPIHMASHEWSTVNLCNIEGLHCLTYGDLE
ncbi:hypothetical protein KIN20_007251 [Parelaphostrongylus tenuis]|uniref:Uncharacterized protein n=1 Tax=Parelaphostrongylus tenuis TaxID=148309 RepID=A0AAD5MNV4_PARTN|nr:hypothetical protein KIN20_007251 [Parelaphostrongylus tenuis]